MCMCENHSIFGCNFSYSRSLTLQILQLKVKKGSMTTKWSLVRVEVWMQWLYVSYSKEITSEFIISSRAYLDLGSRICSALRTPQGEIIMAWLPSESFAPRLCLYKIRFPLNDSFCTSHAYHSILLKIYIAVIEWFFLPNWNDGLTPNFSTLHFKCRMSPTLARYAPKYKIAPYRRATRHKNCCESFEA